MWPWFGWDAGSDREIFWTLVEEVERDRRNGARNAERNQMQIDRKREAAGIAGMRGMEFTNAKGGFERV